MTVTKAQQREATIARLIEVAREVFTRDGYASAATEEIVQIAGVTRGALYHHFGSKEGLFQAVFETLQRQMSQRIEAAAAEHDDVWDQLRAGCQVFLEAGTDPEVQRILLVDAPAVLGWSVWREFDSQNSMKSLHSALGELVNQGRITPIPLDALTHLLSGAMNEAALWIAQSADAPRALAESIQVLELLLQGLYQQSK